MQWTWKKLTTFQGVNELKLMPLVRALKKHQPANNLFQSMAGKHWNLFLQKENMQVSIGQQGRQSLLLATILKKTNTICYILKDWKNKHHVQKSTTMKPTSTQPFCRINFLFSCILTAFSGIAFSQPIANFSADIVSGCTPVLINFSDHSSGNPTLWKWDLGNGTISNLQNPSVTSDVFIYTLQLICDNESILTLNGNIALVR